MHLGEESLLEEFLINIILVLTKLLNPLLGSDLAFIGSITIVFVVLSIVMVISIFSLVYIFVKKGGILND